MSETPQETLTTYIHRGYIKGTLGPGHVREAIRAVLADVEQLRELVTHCPECGAAGECPCIGNWRERAQEAEAEVARLRADREIMQACNVRQDLRAEKAEAEVERLRGERKAVEHVLIQHGVSSSLAVQHLIDDVRTALRGEGEK